jgi:RNA polymerase sigma-70 factor (ECF subfamily)
MLAATPTQRYLPAVVPPLPPTLVARLRMRDREAFAELCRTHRDRLYGIAVSVLRDREEARDVLQETLTSAWRKVDQLEDDAALGAWLGRIVLNHARMRLRSRRRKPLELVDDFETWFTADGHWVNDEPTWPRADDALDRGRLAARLAELAAGLPEELHEVWALADVQHLSMQEIVELTGLHLANVKTRLHRARLLLRERLGAELGRRG